MINLWYSHTIKSCKTVGDYYQCDTKCYQSLKFGKEGAEAVTFQLLSKVINLYKTSLVTANINSFL